MAPEHHYQLLSLAARLDQLLAESNSLLTNPVNPDVAVLAEELRELLVDMQAKGDGHLDG